MQHDATESDAVTDQQRNVIELLLGGRSITDAAALAKVDRSTIYRWQKMAGFVGEMNARRSEMKDAADLRLQAMADMAIGAVEDAILEGDVKTALMVLKGLGWLDEQRRLIGPTNAAGVMKQWNDAERRAKEHELLY